MTKKQITHLSILVIVSIVLNIVLYSNGFLGLRFSADKPLLTAFLVTEILGNILIFIFMTYNIINKPQVTQLYDNKKLVTEKDYYDALESCKIKRTFDDEIELSEKQISRMNEKYNTINVILLEHFSNGGMTYEKFMGSVEQVKNLFFHNLKKMINRISIFNENDYREMLKEPNENSVNIEIYKEHINYVKELIANNNLLLAKLDTLILEISKLNDGEEDKLANMQIMQEIDELINKTKLYS